MTQDIIEDKNMISENYNLWDKLLTQFNAGKVVPIFSNSFFLNRFFTSINSNFSHLHFDEVIAQQWAKDSGYPFRDTYDLANVAQYNLFSNTSDENKKANAVDIKRDYLNLSKRYLQEFLEKNDKNPYKRITEKDLREQTFSRIFAKVYQSYLPGENQQDWIGNDYIFKLVSKLKSDHEHIVKSYLTTGYYDFLEQVFQYLSIPYYTNYSDSHDYQGFVRVNKDKEEEFIDIINPTIPRTPPYVYHIFGHECRNNMVICEDDHIQFLIDAYQPEEIHKSAIQSHPDFCPTLFRNNTLLFIGYRWRDWEFRTLFRWIMGVTHDKRKSLQRPSVVVQFQPGSQKTLSNKKMAQAYLQNYFDKKCQLDILWEDSEEFFCKLLGCEGISHE